MWCYATFRTPLAGLSAEILRLAQRESGLGTEIDVDNCLNFADFETDIGL